MPEPTKRIIVDGVNFSEIFRFPKILRAAASALQPARLAVALFMLVAIVALGRLWDRVTEANVQPAGLMAGRFKTEGDRQAYQVHLRKMMQSYGLPLPGPGEQLDTRDVLKKLAQAHREELARRTTDAERQSEQGTYTSILNDIEVHRPKGDFEATLAHCSDSFQRMLGGVEKLSVEEVISGAKNLFLATPIALLHDQTWFAICFGIVCLVAFSVGGGAISRMAAVQFASNERLRVREAVDFALSRWARLIWAQALPLLIAGIIAGVIVIMGVLMAPYVDVLGGVVYGLVLVLGFLLAFLLVGYAVGSPLLVPAVACENCDGADAMQRSYAYVVTRPLHLLGYWIVALIGLALGFYILKSVAVLTVNSTAELYGWITKNPAVSVAGGADLFNLSRAASDASVVALHERLAAGAIAFWCSLVVLTVGAYVVSYAFSAATIVYLLMRRLCDGQDVEEVWRPGLTPGTLAPIPEPAMAESNASPESQTSPGSETAD